MYHKYSIEENRITLKNEFGVAVKEFSEIDPSVIKFEVSGYNVLKEWLKMHSFPYYRRSLQTEKLLELKILISKLSFYIEMIKELDIEIEQILINELFSPS